MVKCSTCGKDIRLGIDAFCYGELTLCSECNQKIRKEELEKRAIEEKNRKSSELKQHLDKNELSISELQLQELMKMNKDVSKLKNIMVFYIILFIIFIVISILWIHV